MAGLAAHMQGYTDKGVKSHYFKIDDFVRKGDVMNIELRIMESAAARAVQVVRAIDHDQVGLPTPCVEYDVQALYDHLFHMTVGFQRMARREPFDLTAAAPHHPIDAVEFEEETKRLVAAWSGPGALDGTTGSMNLPATLVATLILLDLVIHGWDLARATAQPYEVDDETAALMLDFCEQMGPMARKMGAFTEPVPVPDDAPAFERGLAGSGRDPQWKPSA